VGIVLALSFQRSRMAQLLFMVLVIYWLLIHFSQARWYPGFIELLAILLPLNVLGFAIYRERGLLSLSSVIRLAALVLQAGLVLWFLARHPEGGAALLHKVWWPGLLMTQSPFGQLAQLVMVASLMLGLVLAVRSRSWQESAVFTTLVLLVAVLHFKTNGNQNIIMFTMIPMVTTLAILLDSYSMAYLDELTGLPGRRALREQMDKLGGLYSLAMLDVDHFKKFNDTYGHDVGDQVLKFVAGKMRKVGGGGRAYRYGGEEFTFLFPGKGLEAVEPHLEKVREDIAGSEFALRGKDRPESPKQGSRGGKKAEKSVRITASLGVAEQSGSLLPDEVLKQADEALYRAKSDGRNRVSR
jgi:diguanylate cyclase (GGDEF)-like protein